MYVSFTNLSSAHFPFISHRVIRPNSYPINTFLNGKTRNLESYNLENMEVLAVLTLLESNGLSDK